MHAQRLAVLVLLDPEIRSNLANLATPDRLQAASTRSPAGGLRLPRTPTRRMSGGEQQEETPRPLSPWMTTMWT